MNQILYPVLIAVAAYAINLPKVLFAPLPLYREAPDPTTPPLAEVRE